MNYEDAVRLLLETIRAGDFLFHTEFIKELEKLTRTTLKGHERDFFDRLSKLFSQLSVLGRRITDIGKHEKLSYAEGGEWYSLHIKTNYINARLLMTFFGNKPVFLVCFNEKAGKKVSSYGKYTATLSSRLAEMELKDE